MKKILEHLICPMLLGSVLPLLWMCATAKLIVWIGVGEIGAGLAGAVSGAVLVGLMVAYQRWSTRNDPDIGWERES